MVFDASGADVSWNRRSRRRVESDYICADVVGASTPPFVRSISDKAGMHHGVEGV